MLWKCMYVDVQQDSGNNISYWKLELLDINKNCELLWFVLIFFLSFNTTAFRQLNETSTRLAIVLEEPWETLDFRRYMHSGGRDKLSRICVSRYFKKEIPVKASNLSNNR